jgi:1-acyl-sn-glycerol-3-phosphate acyltransferase
VAFHCMSSAPRSKPGHLARIAGRLWLRSFRWRVEGRLPHHTRAVVIAAPHTSNWDLPFMLAVSWVLGVRPAWLGKHDLFRPPFGALMRWLGGIPVDRRAPGGMVAQAAARLRAADHLLLVVPPSGTRSRAPHWKSGFYYIASAAGVPILCTFLDYRRRVGGIGPTVVPSGDVAADMAIIRAFYAPIEGLRPEQATEVRLAEEDGANAERS